MQFDELGCGDRRSCDGRRPFVAVLIGLALYPAIRTSGLLDELLGRVRLPVTLLYPGRLHGGFGLSFLDLLPPHYGYRAMIIPRGDDE